MTVAVFLGPTLPAAAARDILPADYRPPVRQGDIYRLLRGRRPSAIALIDGYFHEVPSVWHKEILWALDQGIPVHGAASMGALRAAELDLYGMRGHGRIYRAFRDGAFPPDLDEGFEDDDEVAVIHGPAELGYAVLSEAMVDIRATLAAAAEAGVIEAASRRALVAAFKDLNYRERRWDLLGELGAAAAVDPAERARLQAWLPAGRRAQKRDDAVALLDHLAGSGSGAARPGPPAQPFSFERTTLWAQFVEAAGRAAPRDAEAFDRLVLDELRLDPGAFAETRRLAAMRAAALHGAPPPEPSAAGKRRALDGLRQRHGLWTRSGLEAWVQAAGLDGPALERLIEAEAALEAGAEADGAAVDSAMLDLLRLDGRFPRLAERAGDKAERLPPGSEGRPWNGAALVDWFFEERLGRMAPADPMAFARGLGCESLEAFAAILAREHRYLAVCRRDSETARESREGEEP